MLSASRRSFTLTCVCGSFTSFATSLTRRCSEWLPPVIALDDRGFVLTGREVPKGRWLGDRPPAALETTVPGIFAAGDLRAGSMKRVASASGEGAATVALVHAHLASQR